MSTTETESNVEEILRQRAEKYASAMDSRFQRTIVDTVVVLGVGRQKLGVSSRKLEVIDKTPTIAYLPEMPPVIRGVMQIRGELMAAVDVARWFEIETRSGATLLAVVSDGRGRKLGLLVDEVLGFREIAEDELVEGFFGNRDEAGRPISGTTRDLVAIIDVERLFDSAEIAYEHAGLKRG